MQSEESREKKFTQLTICMKFKTTFQIHIPNQWKPKIICIYITIAWTENNMKIGKWPVLIASDLDRLML